MNARLPTWRRSRFEVAADRDLLERLTLEMETRGGDESPAHWWMLPDPYVAGSMDVMLDPWCGTVGQLPLADLEQIALVSGSSSLIPEAWDLARKIDHFGLLRDLSLEDVAGRQWRVCDLYSLIDTLLITAFCTIGARPRVLEIGGGFGRTAEFLAKSAYPDLKYVNVDAVPVSLMYCYQYLKAAFPKKKVSIVLKDEPVDPEADFQVVPAWNAFKIDLGKFDLALNIESFQEMDRGRVEKYIGFIDRHLNGNAFVFLTNSRVYKFPGEYDFPERWKSVFRDQLPHAWTKNHPTEIFQLSDKNSAAQNRVRQVMFEMGRAERLELESQAEKLELRSEIAELNREIERQSADLARLRALLVERNAEIVARAAEAFQESERTNALQAALDAMAGSTSWRVTAPVRGAVHHFPTTARLLRRGVKLMWWTATLQLSSRLAERRRLQR